MLPALPRRSLRTPGGPPAPCNLPTSTGVPMRDTRLPASDHLPCAPWPPWRRKPPGPRPRLPVSERCPSDRTVPAPQTDQALANADVLAAPRVDAGAGAWGSLPLRQRMAHQAPSFSSVPTPTLPAQIVECQRTQAGSGMPRGNLARRARTLSKSSPERRFRPDEKHQQNPLF